MKARSVFACAATGIALMAFGATTAAAETVTGTVVPGPWSALFPCGPIGEVWVANFEVAAGEHAYAAINIDDDVIKPGQEVSIAANCQDPKFASSKISSPF
jgi:hypothetical protein